MAGHISKRGDKWRARFPDPLRGGTAQKERVFRTKAEAEDWLLTMQHTRKSGTYIDPGHGQRTVGEVVDEWRSTWADLEPKTKAGYESILNKHVLPKFERARLSAVTPDEVQKFVNTLAKTRQPNTVRRIYTVLRQVLGMAVNRRYLATNPCDAVKLPKKASNADEHLYLTQQEVRALAEAMPSETYRVATYVAAYCGLRAGELWALRRDDIDLLRGTLRVDQALQDVNSKSPNLLASEKGLLFGPPKSRASNRTMRMPGPIRDMLEAYLSQPLPGGDGPRALIFTTPSGTPIRQTLFFKRVFKKVLVGDPDNEDPAKRRAPALPAHLHGLRWHDLRHTCAALSLSVSPDLHVVKVRLGHEDVRVTINTYGHLLPSVDAALADGLGALFAEAHTDVVPTPIRAKQ